MGKLSRRDVLKLGGLGLAVGAGGGLLRWLTANDHAAAGAGTVPTLTGSPDVEVALTAAPSEVSLFSGKPTRVWRFSGEVLQGSPDVLQTLPDTYLGPIFRLKKGQRVRVKFSHSLPEESIVHWHGLHVPEKDDGHPRLVIKRGETYTYDFQVRDRAGVYWYHPHPHGRTGPQVYRGMAGLFIVSDDEEAALPLPAGEYDIPLVIQDRRFDNNNQLVYLTNNMERMTGFLGNRVLVNGRPDFTLPVATRPYRLRLLNGSNARIYKLAWEDGTPLTVIGTDGGLLEKPVQKRFVTLAPAQRIELWVDFSRYDVGTRLRMFSLPHSAPGGGNFAVFTVEVAREEKADLPLPDKLTTHKPLREADAVNAASPRTFTLAMTMGRGWTINGRTFQMTAVARDEIVRLGDTEVWSFNYPGGGMMGGMMGGRGGGGAIPHPMHVHDLQYRILRRQVSVSGRSAWETLSPGFVDEGWHDTVLVMPGEKVDILLRFEDFEGLYLYHCHNLEHEDMGMMRNYRVKA